MPDLVIQAVNVGPGGSSAVVTAEFLFQAGNPKIIGDNAAQFTISDITTNVTLWYTIDGSDPTNTRPAQHQHWADLHYQRQFRHAFPSFGQQILFQARAFRQGYQPSGIASQIFTPANYVPNTISFGFASGEASSDFVASPGQTFYAPVTLSPLPGTVIYSLQFNLTVTNAGPNPGPAITPGAFNFQSMLVKPDPESRGYYMNRFHHTCILPTAANPAAAGTDSVLMTGTNFVSLVTTNTSLQSARRGLAGTLHQDKPLQHHVTRSDPILHGP